MLLARLSLDVEPTQKTFQHLVARVALHRWRLERVRSTTNAAPPLRAVAVAGGVEAGAPVTDSALLARTIRRVPFAITAICHHPKGRMLQQLIPHDIDLLVQSSELATNHRHHEYNGVVWCGGVFWTCW